MIEIKIPSAVEEVLRILHEKGEEAYIVGGCVRDSLMNITPKDWDITTSATPIQVKSFFAKTIDTGIKHGTVTVLHQKEAIEITTYRVDGKYEDHRRPSQVSFTKSLKEDVARRDFTVNAMAYSPQNQLIDYFDGQGDLKRKLIRCVGKAEQRFEEDALRMMRAVRFAAVLHFEIEEDTARAITIKKELIQAVSQERIRVEFVKTIQSHYPEYVSYFEKFGLRPYIFPEFTFPLNFQSEFYQVLKKLPGDGLSRLTYFFGLLGHGKVAAKEAKTILKRLTFDNHSVSTVVKALEYGDINLKLDDFFFRKLLSQLGYEVTMILMNISSAENKNQMSEMIPYIERARLEPITIADLDINGNDIMSEGIAEGKEIGRCLAMLLELVLENPKINQRHKLIKILKESKF